jgi:membrane-associated phospholipid phosphatase
MAVEVSLGALIADRTFTNQLSYANPNDSLSFSLSSTQNVRLNANANILLSRANMLNGELTPTEAITRSWHTHGNDQVISQTLTAGNYMIDVSNDGSRSIDYKLQLSTHNPGQIYDVNTLSGPETFTGTIGKPNPIDLYRFRLDQRSDLQINLGGLSGDASLVLGADRNRNGVFDAGEEIGRSDRAGILTESLNRTGTTALAAGEYLIQVKQVAGDTHYRLALTPTAINVASQSGHHGRHGKAVADLTGEIRSVTASDIRRADSSGQAQVNVTNQGLGKARGLVRVNLYASTNQTIDANDQLLGSQTRNLDLHQGQSQLFNFHFGAPTGVAPGMYYLVARVDSSNAIGESNEQNNDARYAVSAPGTDVIVDWNAMLLNAIQAVETSPAIAARHQAMVHAAMFDAVNGIEGHYQPFLAQVHPECAVGASSIAAAAQAAYQVLVDLYPTQRSEFAMQLARSLSEVPDRTAADRGIAIGQWVAEQMLTHRRNDGIAAAQDVYIPGTAPGSYQFTRPDNFVALPKFGKVVPFVMDDVNHFVPNGLPAYGSDQYAVELNQVQRLGGIDSPDQTGEQAEIALFWGYDRPDTFRPPAQWDQIAQTIAIKEGTSLLTNARLFAHLNVAQADAGIAAWQTKYVYNQLRPITAIRIADQDGNDQTIADPNWQSFLPTPPFPDYISGHATFGGAAAAVLEAYFGQNYAFTMTSQEMPGVYRSFDSFAAAADENGISRIYGGVHIEAANRDGVMTGRNVANYVLNHAMLA